MTLHNCIILNSEGQSSFFFDNNIFNRCILDYYIFQKKCLIALSSGFYVKPKMNV